MTWDPVDNYVLLFGGYNGAMLSDTWAFVNGTWTQLSPASSPPGRYGAMMAWDTKDGYAVLFGGYSISGAVITIFNDTWTFVHGAWTNVTGKTGMTPENRWRGTMTFDAGDNYLLMFGGSSDANGFTNPSTTWSFSGGKWSQLNVSGSPPARYRAEMTYDAQDGYAIIFGGCTTSACPDSTTWTYHNLVWTKRAPVTSPTARIYFGFTYSTSYHQPLLWGGSSTAGNNPLADTWTYTNGNWTDLTKNITRAPAGIPYLSMVYDPIDNYSVMFGGQWSNGTFSQKTWALGASILGHFTLAPSAIDLGQTAQLNATPITYSKWVSFTYATLPPGCTSANVSILNCTPNSAGRYPVKVVLNDSTKHPVTELGNLTVSVDPVLSSFVVLPAIVTAGTVTHFKVTASGGTGALTYFYSGLPAGCGSSSTKNLSCTPTQAGMFLVHVRVMDGAGFTLGENTTLQVNPTPTFVTVLAKPATVDVGQTLTLYANVTGGTGPFNYTYQGLPQGCASVSSPVLTCVPTMASGAAVVVNATDLFGWVAHATINITVNVDPAITSAAIAPAASDAGQALTLWVNATGGTGGLSYRFTGQPPGCTLTDHSQNVCTPTTPGTYTIMASVVDEAGFLVSTPLHLTVNPTVVLPSFTVSPTGVDVGQNITFVAVVTGGTAPVTFGYTGLPVGCAGSITAATIKCAARTAGTYTVGLTVTDKWRSTATGAVQLVVYPDPSVGAFNLSVSPVTSGQKTVLTVTVVGGSGSYTYQWSGLPTGCPAVNNAVVPCTPTAPGAYKVSLVVTDSAGLTATSGFNMTVAKPPSTAGSTLLGLPTETAWIVIAALVAVVIIAATAFLVRRPPRRRAPAPLKEPAPAGATGAEESPAWAEGPGT